MRRIPESDEESLAIVGKYYLELASKWMDFVLKRCEKGRGSRPRWSGQGMKFLVEAIHPTISCRLSQLEFEVSSCKRLFSFLKCILIRGEPMFKNSRLPIPIVKGRYLQIIGRLIGKTDGCFFYQNG